MKFIKNIFVLSLLLFFISCTAWPALIPVPPGKKKTQIYPIPLPGQTTSSIPNLRIANASLAALGDSPLAYNATLQLKAIDKAGAEVTTGITWNSGSPTVATVSATGLVTALAIDGVTNITATQASTSSTATIKITVSSTGKSLLAFDGVEFKQIGSIPVANANEEK